MSVQNNTAGGESVVLERPAVGGVADRYGTECGASDGIRSGSAGGGRGF